MSKILDSKIYKAACFLFKLIFGSLVLLYLSVLVIQRVSDNGSVAGYRVFSVASPSMVPVYEINDVLLVKEVKEDDLKVDDDVTYMGTQLEMAGKIVTHRIINIETQDNGSKKITTKGVANEESDPSITYDQIYGKVVSEIKIISLLNNLLRTTYGFFFLVFVPLVVLITLEVIETINDKRKEQEEKSKEKPKRKAK